MTHDQTLEPSTFELDVYFAGGAHDTELAHHITHCTRCAAYLAHLGELEREAAPVLRVLAVERSQRPRSFESTRLFAAMAATGAVAALLTWLSMSNQRGEGYVGRKAVPAVQVLIRSQGRSRLWDGKSAIHAGDAIALYAGCDRFTQLSVVVQSKVERAQRSLGAPVFAGACQANDDPLPFSLIADEQPGNESIAVIFSLVPLDERALRRAWERMERTDTVWVSEILLPKTTAKP